MTPHLASRFRHAVRLSLASRYDVARGVHRAYRTLWAYELGERPVTAAVACALAGYLRQRAGAMLQAAGELETAVRRKEATR